MEHHTESEQAVLDVIARECTAFWMRDEAGFCDCHAPGDDTLRWGYWHGGGVFARRGADSIVPASIAHMRRLERAFPEIPRARVANVVVHVSGDMAWVRLDRLVPHIPDMRHGHGPNGTMQLLFILERIDGQWLIVVTTMLDAHLGDEVAVRVDAAGTVIWKSRRAQTRLADDPNFVLRNGRLRLRQRRLDLQSAIRWAVGLSGPLMPKRGAVPLLQELVQPFRNVGGRFGIEGGNQLLGGDQAHVLRLQMGRHGDPGNPQEIGEHFTNVGAIRGHAVLALDSLRWG